MREPEIPSDVVVKPCRHGRFMFDPKDELIGRSLDAYGEWCESEMAVLAQIVTPGSVVVDVGANIGTHTVFFARATGAAGAVIAFEPQRAAYHMLCGNVALNGLRNVTCVQAGAGAARGTAWAPAAGTNAGAVALSRDATTGEQVDVIPIDELELPGCGLVKIDVEGMEAEVIAGARRTIERHAPALFVENNTEEGSRAILEAVASVGYRAYWHIAPYFNPRNWSGNPVDAFQQYRPEANVLCVPFGVPVSGLLPASGTDDHYLRALVRGARASA